MTTFSRALIEVTIAAPADEVWKSLRDRERIGQWFGWDSDSLPAEIEFIFFKRAHAHVRPGRPRRDRAARRRHRAADRAPGPDRRSRLGRDLRGHDAGLDRV